MLSLNDLVAAVATLSGDPSSFWNQSPSQQNDSNDSQQQAQPIPIPAPISTEWYPAPSGINFGGNNLLTMGITSNEMGLGMDLGLGTGISVPIEEHFNEKNDDEDPFLRERAILLSENSLIKTRAGIQVLAPEHLF